MNPRSLTSRSARTGAVLSLLLLGFTPRAAAQEEEETPAAAPPTPPPSFQFLRQNEDWSAFVAGSGRFDRFKHVPLSDDGEIWASFGGRVEARFESWHDFNFGAPPNQSTSDDFVLSRLLMHGDFHFGERVRVFAEGKTAQSTDRDLPGGRRPLDMDTLAVQQLFVDGSFDLGESSDLTVRGGRQMLSFGKQRLVSPLPWGNTLRTWDGFSAWVDSGDWRTTGLATAFVPVDKTGSNQRDDEQLLYGVYATHSSEKGSGLDLYALGNTREDVVVNGTAGDADRYTLGARRWGTSGDVDWELEGAWQLGEVGSDDVSAGFATAVLGYQPSRDGWAPRWYLGADWASGDSSSGGKVGTFDQLYPLGHAYFGYIDTVGRQNILAGNVGVSVKPADRWTVGLTFHAFWLDSKDDAFYNAGGGVVRPGGSFDSSELGTEIDLNARWQVDRHLSVYAGYSHFFAGEAIDDSGPSDDIDFVYVGFGYTF